MNALSTLLAGGEVRMANAKGQAVRVLKLTDLPVPPVPEPITTTVLLDAEGRPVSDNARWADDACRFFYPSLT